jgi:hypothetical protein
MEPITTVNNLTVTPQRRGQLIILEGTEPRYYAEIAHKDGKWTENIGETSHKPNNRTTPYEHDTLVEVVKQLDNEYGPRHREWLEWLRRWEFDFGEQWKLVVEEFE